MRILRRNNAIRQYGIQFIVLVLAIVVAQSQTQPQPGVQSRNTNGIDDISLVSLKGNTLALAVPQNDLGPVDGSIRADRVMLILKRSPKQESDLQSYLQAVQQPDSAVYRKFLTSDEFGRRYGISDADLARVEGWLQGYGLSVEKVNKGRSAIEFSGTVSQVQEAFHTSIHRFLIRGVEHMANTSDPQIPAALAPVVAGVASLNDFKPRPNFIKGPAGTWDAKAHRFRPDLTILASGTSYLLIGPGDAATIYDSPNALNTKFATGKTAYDGTGVAIGIVGTTDLNDSGYISYRILFGLPDETSFTTLYDDGSTIDFSEDETEAILDVEVSGALAPGASGVYYAAGDTEFQSGLFLAIYRAIDDNKADILNVSYGECEALLGAAGNLQVLNAWEQAAAQGITVTVSSGDSGSAGCDNQDVEMVASHGLGVNGLASTPYNIAVGGTDFDVLAGGFGSYVTANETANFTSASGYIPENPWNDSTVSNGLLAANTVYRDSTGATNIIAGGGGASSAGNGGTAGYGKPPWQKGFSPSAADSVRDVPDVSLFAGNGEFDALWAICESATSDCSNGDQSSIHAVGGTSASAPAFAGMLALVMQKSGTGRLGQANWVLYKLAQTSPAAFHQITTGNNSVYCSPSSPNCGTNQFLTGYNAGSSYNLATGLGSVDVSTLVNDWNTDTLTATTATLSLSKTTFTHGTSVTIGASVSPASATGDVAITNNYASQSLPTVGVAPFRLALSNGSASGSFSELPGGQYNVYANYPGDGTHAGSVSQPVQVTVSPEGSILNFSANTVNSASKTTNLAGQTVPLGTSITVIGQPIGQSQAGSGSPIMNATGAVTFTDTTSAQYPTEFGAILLDATGTAEATTTSMNAGTHSVTASYSGDQSYSSSNAGPIDFTVAPAPTSISLTASPTSTFDAPISLNALIATNVPSSFNSGIGGPVTFTDTTSNTVLGTSYADINTPSQCPSTTTLCLGSAISVSSTQLAAGSNTIVASYGGNSNFRGSGPSASIVVTCTAGCYTANGQSLSLSFGQESSGDITAGGTVTAVVSVGPGGGFTGAVNLTCTVAGTGTADVHLPTCSFNPTQVSIASDQAVNSTLTLSTTAPITSSLRHRASGNAGPGSLFATGGTALATLLFLGWAPRRFRRKYLMALLGLVAVIGWMSGCGGGSGGGGGGGGTTLPGTTADTYTVTFRAADAATGTVTAQDGFKFTVN